MRLLKHPSWLPRGERCCAVGYRVMSHHRSHRNRTRKTAKRKGNTSRPRLLPPLSSSPSPSPFLRTPRVALPLLQQLPTTVLPRRSSERTQLSRNRKAKSDASARPPSHFLSRVPADARELRATHRNFGPIPRLHQSQSIMFLLFRSSLEKRRVDGLSVVEFSSELLSEKGSS